MQSAALGIPIGLVTEWAVARGLRNALFGVAPTDPLTFMVVDVFAASVVIVASVLAGQRATQVVVDAARRVRSGHP